MPADPSHAQIDRLLAPLRAGPTSAAIVSDVDGTLAPIVERPEDARVPPEPRALLAALAQRFGLVACVSGRRALEARSLVGLDELTYVGNHGLEQLNPGDAEPVVAPKVLQAAAAVEEFSGRHLDRSPLESLGLRIEDKGPIRALHWRGAADEQAAEAAAQELAARAVCSGLEARWGRKVLELRPALDIDKGTALVDLLSPPTVESALYAGDDRTDVDAFRALSAMRDDGALSASVAVGIATPESPAEISSEADLIVSDPPGFWAILRRLAGPLTALDPTS